MNYGIPAARSHVTPIEQLPELTDVESSQYQLGPQQGRGGYQGNQRQSSFQGMGNLPPGMEQKYSKLIRQRHVPLPQAGMAPRNAPVQNEIMHVQQPQPRQEINLALHNISCLDIANHIQDCPICSRFYNNDKTIYIICIVVLAIVCLLLLKRVLNV